MKTFQNTLTKAAGKRIGTGNLCQPSCLSTKDQY